MAYVYPVPPEHAPPIADVLTTNANRLLEARDSHLYGYRQQVVEAYSTFANPIPNPTAIALMGLADDYRRVEAVSSMKDVMPFPGVRVGPLPSVHAAPAMIPTLGAFDHHRHHSGRR